MPFENAHGNGGMLTTVGDLLRWNAALDAGTLAGADFAAAEQKTGTLSDGRPLRYAMGLYVDTWRGTREVSHGGATAGYRAGLARYPEQALSVAILCNADDVRAGGMTRDVAEIFLEGRLAAEPPPPPRAAVGADVLAARAGLYRHARTMDVLKLDVIDGVLKADGRDALVPVDDRTFLFEPSRQRGSRSTPIPRARCAASPGRTRTAPSHSSASSPRCSPRRGAPGTRAATSPRKPTAP